MRPLSPSCGFGGRGAVAQRLGPQTICSLSSRQPSRARNQTVDDLFQGELALRIHSSLHRPKRMYSLSQSPVD